MPRMTTPTEGHTAVSPQQKAQFLRDGFIRLDNVITEEELDWYRERYDSLFTDGSRVKELGGKDEQGRSALPQILSPSETMPELLERPYFQRIGEIARAILGPEAKFKNDHMIFKPAGHGAATPWHQDQAYHDPSKYYININFWMPLQHATVEGGCMQYVRNSHRGTLLPHRHLIPGDRSSALVAENQDYWSMNGTSLPCQAGSVCLHHSYCLHYAGPNQTSQPRRAYIIVYSLPSADLEQPFVLPWQRDPARP